MQERTDRYYSIAALLGGLVGYYVGYFGLYRFIDVEAGEDVLEASVVGVWLLVLVLGFTFRGKML